jgi:hypothetical protein
MESIQPTSNPSRQNCFSDTATTPCFHRQSVALNFLLRNSGFNPQADNAARIVVDNLQRFALIKTRLGKTGTGNIPGDKRIAPLQPRFS